jgi:hypothetical protein
VGGTCAPIHTNLSSRLLGGIVTAVRACGRPGGSIAKAMTKISYAGYRFPPEIIQQAIWLYLRFMLSLRDVEDLLAERGISVSYETVRRWVNHFGPMIAADLRKRRAKPHTTWHLDEVYLKINGRMIYLWRAVDAEGEVLDVLVQSRNDKRAAADPTTRTQDARFKGPGLRSEISVNSCSSLQHLQRPTSPHNRPDPPALPRRSDEHLARGG